MFRPIQTTSLLAHSVDTPPKHPRLWPRQEPSTGSALFGSVARGEDRPDSDIDILVEFEPGAEGSIYDHMRLKEYVALH